MSEQDELDKFIQDLVDAGAINTMISPETGEVLYQLNENIETLVPGLWEEHEKELRKMLHRLWEKGVITIMFSEEGPLEDTVALTDDAFNPEVLGNLSEMEYEYLKSLIYTFDNNFSD